MTGRKPRRSEIRARYVETALRMRAWLDESKANVAKSNARQAKADLLAGETGGGSGVTVDMRQISAEASQRPQVVANPGGYTGPNRADRRARRRRYDRAFVPGARPGQAGRWVWPTPPGVNQPYYAPRADGTGDHA